MVNRGVDQPIGLRIVDEPLGDGIPVQLATHLDGDVSQMAEGRDAMSHLGRLQRFLARFDAIDKILFIAFQPQNPVVRAGFPGQQRAGSALISRKSAQTQPSLPWMRKYGRSA
jgi:hypothetical protein